MLFLSSTRVALVDCRKVRARISAFVDGELSPGESSQFEDHLGRCDTCSSLRSQFEAQGQTLRLLPPEADSRLAAPEFWAPMDAVLSEEMDRIERETESGELQPSTTWGRRRYSVPLPAVMAYAGVLALAIWWGWSHADANSVENIEVASPVTELEKESPSDEPALAEGAHHDPKIVADEGSVTPVILQNDSRVRVPPELVRPAAYRPHRGIF